MDPIIFVVALGIIIPLIYVIIKKNDKSTVEIIDLFLLYQLVFSVGMGGLMAYYAHVFRSVSTAEYIGWPPGNPFQQEVGYANLAFGILGILCIWFRNNFWTAVIFGFSIWSLANAYGHIKQIQLVLNYAPGNAGIPLYLDVFLPILLLSLLITRSALTIQKTNN
jgi:hypothetical protein